jgi:hypothetical protein
MRARTLVVDVVFHLLAFSRSSALARPPRHPCHRPALITHAASVASGARAASSASAAML